MSSDSLAFSAVMAILSTAARYSGQRNRVGPLIEIRQGRGKGRKGIYRARQLVETGVTADSGVFLYVRIGSRYNNTQIRLCLLCMGLFIFWIGDNHMTDI